MTHHISLQYTGNQMGLLEGDSLESAEEKTVPASHQVPTPGLSTI